MKWVRVQLGFEGLFAVDPIGRSVGIALLWKERDQAKLISFSQNHIDVEVMIEGMNKWRLSGVYGEPNRGKKHKTWDLLQYLARDSNLTWCVMGDLNNVTSATDKIGGLLYPQWLIDGFNDALQDAGLIDMNIVGHQYTWERGVGMDKWMEVRLDRALTTSAWLNEFSVAKLYNLEGVASYHSPILLVPKQVSKTNYMPRFRFENAWCLDPMCAQLVQDGWDNESGINI
ncbi:uncharacterized protein LOC141701475 [Apium graveolens]|uniref:uncharacterized protein LOC141689791 n=1 Tax=Apium graveolens TaxID=4045 RepID=UPI003D79DD1F